MGKKIKIGISGSYGGLNLGDEAILQSIITQIRKYISADITVFSRNAKDTQRRHCDVRAIDVRQYSSKEIKQEVTQLDLFILGGGGILYDADAKTYLREVIIAIENQIPVMLFAIGVGPLTVSSVQKHVKEVLNEVDLITVREFNALRILENIGVEKEIHVTADPALLLRPEPMPDKMLKFVVNNWEQNRKLIGISVREPGVAAPDIDERIYHSLIADAADFMLDRLNAEIVFIPMEHHVQDMQHSHAVVSKMLKPQRATVLKGSYTSGQILNFIGQLDFALGMRLHFLIFSALQKVPFVALPYASKIEGFLDDLNIQMPPFHNVNAGRLIAHIDSFWDKQDHYKIQENLTKLKERSSRSISLLIDLLVSKSIIPEINMDYANITEAGEED